MQPFKQSGQIGPRHRVVRDERRHDLGRQFYRIHVATNAAPALDFARTRLTPSCRSVDSRVAVIAENAGIFSARCRRADSINSKNDGYEAKKLLDSIDVSTIVGLRDRALIALLVYSFARVSAALHMNVEDC